MIDILIQALLIVAFAGFSAKRLMTYLHALQQDDYDTGRFAKWVTHNKVFDTKLSAIVFILGIVWLANAPMFAIQLVVFTALTSIAYFEKDPRRDSKKKLAMTSRAKRIFISSFICIALSGSFVFAFNLPLIWLLCVHAIPF